MDMDVDHIWDLPVDHPPATTADPGPLNPSNPPLFLPSDEEAEVAATAQPSANKDPDIDALFDGIDDLNEFAPALDLDALRREADARNTRLVRAEISASIPSIQLSTTTTTKSGDGRKGPLDGVDGGDENDDGKKKRKPIPRLDEARLLGKNGLPQLVKDTKNFKPKGKGHEVTYFHPTPSYHLIDDTALQAADLDRVLQVYQFWTHRLYPKTRFKETVDRVEKLCHSKRMQVRCSSVSYAAITGVERYRNRWHSAYGATRPRDSSTASDYLPNATTTITLTQTRTPTTLHPATQLLQPTKALHHRANRHHPPGHDHACAVPPRAMIQREKATHRAHHRRRLIETKRPSSWARFSRKKEPCTRLPTLRKRTTRGRNRRRQPTMQLWTQTMIYGLHWTRPLLPRRYRHLLPM
jgi:hypothetical protein